MDSWYHNIERWMLGLTTTINYDSMLTVSQMAAKAWQYDSQGA